MSTIFVVSHEFLDYTHAESEEFETREEAEAFFKKCVDEREEDYDDCFELSEITVDDEGEWIHENVIDSFEIREYNHEIHGD